MVHAAWKHEVLDVTTCKFERHEKARTRIRRNLKLNRLISLALCDCRPCPDFWAARQIADLQLDKITVSQLAINR